MTQPTISIIGAGLGGALMAVLLARRGFTVDVYERRPDLRRTEIPAGRSINLALANRGLAALAAADLEGPVRELLTTMRGRMVHDLDGTVSLQPYGQREHEVIHSVSRPGLNELLLNAAQACGDHVRLHFEHACRGIDFAAKRLAVEDLRTGSVRRLEGGPIICADGAGSRVRRALVEQTGARATEDVLPHDYKELTIPAAADGDYLMDPSALHIWPRGGFMMIALPNLDGSFTATLFAPHEGEHGFSALADRQAVQHYFETHFPDATALMPALTQEFEENPTGHMVTVHCQPWRWQDFCLLIGDASHAIVPFHGQGMNAAFEDCARLDALIGEAMAGADGAADALDWQALFARFETLRKPSADAIAQMALENYGEMRDAVRDPVFLRRREVGFELERRFPETFIPRYSMVMFHLLPYAHALERGRAQQEILEALVPADAPADAPVDWARAEHLVRERLAPLVARLTADEAVT